MNVMVPSPSVVQRDAVFLPQFRSELLPDGVPWGPRNGNCGPTSVVNALRLVGLDVPGFAGERSQAVIDAARRMISGSDDPSAATLKTQQAFALRGAGADVDVTYALGGVLDAVRGGAVAVIGGNRAADGWPRRSDDPPPQGVANHSVVIARHEGGDAFNVFDSALHAPVRVSREQLERFVQADAQSGRMPRLGVVVRAGA